MIRGWGPSEGSKDQGITTSHSLTRDGKDIMQPGSFISDVFLPVVAMQYQGSTRRAFESTFGSDLSDLSKLVPNQGHTPGSGNSIMPDAGYRGQ